MALLGIEPRRLRASIRACACFTPGAGLRLRVQGFKVQDIRVEGFKVREYGSFVGLKSFEQRVALGAYRAQGFFKGFIKHVQVSGGYKNCGNL